MVKNISSEGKIEENHKDNDEDPGLMAAGADLIRAVHAKDEKGAAQAIRAAFEMLQSEASQDSEPSEFQSEQP